MKNWKICSTKIFLFFIFFYLLIGRTTFAAERHKETSPHKFGPVAIRNQMPLYLFYLQIVPDKAEVAKRNKLVINTDYTVSNITVSAFTPVTSLYDIDIDLEVSRITLDIRYGVYDGLEIGLEIPYISLSSGYLDNIIEGIEDGIGAKTPRSRERQGSYEFDYSFRYNNVYLIQKKHSTQGIGDIVLNLKYQLLRESGWLPNVSLRSAVKFPTGEKDNLIGSGEMDYGFGMVMDKSLSDRTFLYIGANVMVIGKPSFFSVLGLDEQYYSGMLAMEYLLTEHLSFVAQVTGNTTPYPHSNTNVLDNDAYEFGLGVNYLFKEKTNLTWHLAIVENIRSASSPDATVHTGFNWKF